MRFKKRMIPCIAALLILILILISRIFWILYAERHTHARVSPVPVDMEEIFRENAEAFTEMAELLLEYKKVFYQLNQETGLLNTTLIISIRYMA